MAIDYYELFTKEYGSQNFGDNINPYLLGKLLSPSVLQSTEVCVIGVGTILSRVTAERVSGYRRKVVFSTGTGYGEVPDELDDSWDFACVRGPKTAEAMGLPSSNAVCDGAILLSDYFEPVEESKRSGIVFIPHIRTHWWAGEALRPICDNLKWNYLTPDLPAEEFIDGVKNARLVITEAMHGAILADTMRVPWVPVAMHQHNEFKWEDWFLSIDQDYYCNFLFPKLWKRKKSGLVRKLKYPYQKLKMYRVQRQLMRISRECTPSLSSEQVLREKKAQLRQVVEYINQTYSV